MNIEKLFEEVFLKKIPKSEARVEKSLKVAENYLIKAKKNFDINIDDIAIITAYSSVFHAARAVLFNDGVGERSHFAVFEYLREKHPSIGINEVNSADMYRKLRHGVSYGLDTVVTEKDSLAAINFAASFLEKIKKYLGEKKTTTL